MRSSTISKVLGVLVGAIIIGAIIGWWSSKNPLQTDPISVSGSDLDTNSALNLIIPQISSVPPTVVESIQSPVAPSGEPSEPISWEDRLDDILGSDAPEEKKGEELLAMMPQVSTEAQVELAGHIINLIDGAQFLNAANYLTNSAVPEEVSSVFMNDLYNRDEALKLPLLLEVARNDKHSLRDEARDLLELYVEEDYGKDWAKWEEATKKYLKERAEESPEPVPESVK